MMDLKPCKLLFKSIEHVSLLYLSLCLYIDTYFSKNPNGINIPTERKMIHIEGHVCGFKVFLLALDG
jgi:hypothetical protein